MADMHDPQDEIINSISEHIEKLDHQNFYKLMQVVESERERRMDGAEGDILSRRRRCDSILNEPGRSYPYASLTVYRMGDYISIRDVDGRSCGVIQLQDLPDEDPERIEALQERLDEYHLESLSEL